MIISIDRVKEAVKEKYGWDDSYAFQIEFVGDSERRNGDTVDYLTADGDQMIIGLNEKEEVVFIEII